MISPVEPLREKQKGRANLHEVWGLAHWRISTLEEAIEGVWELVDLFLDAGELGFLGEQELAEKGEELRK